MTNTLYNQKDLVCWGQQINICHCHTHSGLPHCQDPSSLSTPITYQIYSTSYW
jgi:hypothetical protein